MLYVAAILALVAAFLPAAVEAAPSRTATFGVARLSNGISLHYADEGHGEPVIFVPGSLTDYGYWENQVEAFSRRTALSRIVADMIFQIPIRQSVDIPPSATRTT